MASRAFNKLTTRKVETARDGFHSDGGNLFLRVSDGGRRRSWVYRFVRRGKVTSIGLGAARAVTLREARERRDEVAKLVEQGLDPLVVRWRKREEQDGKKTYAEAAGAYIAQHQRGWSGSSLGHWKRSMERDCAPLAKLAVADIGLDDVKCVVMPLADQGFLDTARKTQSRIHAILNYAVEHGWRAEDKRSAWSPIVKRRKGEQPHHPMLPWEDAPAIVAALRERNGLAARVLEFLILTATRVSEAREARWSEIDLAARTWTIPASRTKTRQPHDVPLSDRAFEIVDELKAHRTSDLVFFGHRDGRPISRMAIWAQAKRSAGGQASPHGFRATFRSWCADHGVEFEVAESALAHAAGGVVRAYQRSAMTERRRPLMADWAVFLSGETSNNVVAFNTRAR
jgi:integrase